MDNLAMSPTSYTEEAYTALLDRLCSRWRPVTFHEDLNRDWIVLWRHDVDYSPQRALALARIEAQKGIVATYFFQIRSSFYNCLEPGMEKLIAEIAVLGHDVGLHFDTRPYGGENCPQGRLVEALNREIRFFGQSFGSSVAAFSLHNPTLSPPGFVRAAGDGTGLPCADAPRFHDGFLYASDSRGGWRRCPLPLVLEERTVRRLHILTHPVRWTPEACTPRQTLERHLAGWNAAKANMLRITAAAWEQPIDETADGRIQDRIFGERP